MSGQDPFPDKIKNFHFDIRARKTQLTLGSIFAAVILVVALIALPSSHKKAGSATSANGDQTASDISGKIGDQIKASGGGSNGSGPLSGSGGTAGGHSSGSVGS